MTDFFPRNKKQIIKMVLLNLLIIDLEYLAKQLLRQKNVLRFS